MRLIDVMTSPWVIVPDKLIEIREIYKAHLRGEKVDIESLEARLGKELNNEYKNYEVVNGVAIIPVHGVIAKKMNLFHSISGGASSELIGRDFTEAVQDDDIKGIILDIDSPGGAVDGTPELANTIYSARGKKPIVAYTNGSMCSGACWIGMAADKSYISSDVTMVGSIGVVYTHVDESGYEEKRGFKTTEITAGKYKRIASGYQPLSQEGREYIQAMADYIYSVFVNDIAKFKNVSVEKVLSDMADGKIHIGKQAISVGLVYGISTPEEIINNLHAELSAKKYFTGGSIMANTQATNNTVQQLTAEQVAQLYPDAYAQIKSKGYIEGIDEGMKEGRVKGYDEGLKKGAEDERKRIQEVEAQALPGHDALIKGLKFDGKTTGPEAAVQVLNAEREKMRSRYKQIESEAIKPVPPSNTDASQFENSGVDPNLPVEERAKAEWDKSPNVRSEFMSFESYLAYKKASESGRARILNQKGGSK